MAAAKSRYVLQSVLIPKSHADAATADDAAVKAREYLHGYVKAEPATKNFYAFRAVDPKLLDPKTYRSVKLPKGVVLRSAKPRADVLAQPLRLRDVVPLERAEARARLTHVGFFRSTAGWPRVELALRLSSTEAKDLLASARKRRAKPSDKLPTTTLRHLIRHFGGARVAMAK